MEPTYRTLFLTDRGLRHQQQALAGAPPMLMVDLRRAPDRATLLGLLPEIDFLISERTGVIDAELLAAGRRLRLVQRLGRQIWDIDLDAARQAQIPVCYLPLPGCGRVAEHVLLLGLSLMKKLPELMAVTTAADWDPTLPRLTDEDHFAYNWTRRHDLVGLAGRTVGILGFGEIGLELARRLQAFECTVVYHRRRALPPETEREYGVRYAASFESLAAASDLVVTLLPFRPETAHCLNTRFFAAMRRGAWLVHAGGSGTLDETALVAALRSGHLAGAALDTFTWEPFQPDHPLVQLARSAKANVILTPHVAAGTASGTGPGRAGDYINILAHLEGRPLSYQVA